MAPRASLLRALSARRSEPARSAEPSGGFYPDWRAGRPLPRTWDAVKAVEEGFYGCSWVFACISRLADACSSVPWRVMQRKGEEWEPDDGNPLEIAIEYPNEDISRQTMVHRAVQHLGLTGNAYLRTVYVRDQPDTFWPLSPAVTDPIADAAGWLAGYEVKPPGRSRPDRYEKREIVHAQRPDPLDPLRGVSPLRAARRAVDMDTAMVEWNRETADRGGMPWAVFTGVPLEQRDRARKVISEQLKAHESDRFLLLHGATKIDLLALTPQEADWLASRDFTLKEVCAIYGVLPSLFDPQSKYANVEQARKWMWEDGAMTMLSCLEDAFNTRLVPRQKRRDMWIHFDLSGVAPLQDNIHKRLETHERAVRSGVPPNASFLLLDLPIEAQPGGDIPLVDAGLERLEVVAGTEEKPEPEPSPFPPEPPELDEDGNPIPPLPDPPVQ